MTGIKLNVYEERVLRIMRRYYDWMNTHEIACESNIHWATAKKSLTSLSTKTLISYKNEDGKHYWQANQKI